MSDNTSLLGVKVVVAIVMALLAVSAAGYILYVGDLSLNTSVQPAVRNNIVHQAPLVIGNNAEFHNQYADIQTDATAITTDKIQLNAFTSTHNLSNLSYTDNQMYQQEVQNLSSAENDITSLVNTYNQNMQNQDKNFAADGNLPQHITLDQVSFTITTN